MTIDSDIRTALRQTADGAEAPVIDPAGFERRVRHHRSRRRTNLVGVTAVVATAVLAVPLAVSHIGFDSGTSPASAPATADPTRPQIWFYTENGPRVLTPDGVIHEVTDPTDTDTFEPGGVAILGRTRDGAIVAPHAGGLERLQLVQQGDRWRFERMPLSGESFGSGAVSADGRYFAASTAADDPQHEIVVFDLSTDQEVGRVPVSGNIFDYSDRVLWQHRASFTLGFGPDRVEIPASNPNSWGVAGGDIVAVWEPRAITPIHDDYSSGTVRLYDVSSGTARQIGTIEGGSVHGALSPDGRYYLSPRGQRPLVLWERDGDESQSVTGLDDRAGTVRDIAWLDADTAAVLTRIPDRATIWTCEASTLQCEEVYAFAMTPGNASSWLEY